MFRVDPALRATGSLRVSGGDTETATCPDDGAAAKEGEKPPPEKRRETHPFEAGRQIAFGDVRATVEAVRTDARVAHLMADANLRALAATREAAGQTAEAARLQLAVAQVAKETSTKDGATIAHAAAKASGAVASTLSAIDDLTTLANLPTSSTEQISFALRVERGTRVVVTSCQSVDVVHTFRLFAGPDFAMDCIMVPAAKEPGAPWAVQVRATGSSRSYRFSGGLARATPRTELLFGDQHFGMWGTTMVTGFEVRRGAAQTAAVSFYPYVNGKYADEPRVWLSPADPTDLAEQDVRAAMMALAIVYPWPTPCSTAQKSPAR